MVKSVEAIEERRQALMRDAWGAARAHKKSKISQAPRWGARVYAGNLNA